MPKTRALLVVLLMLLVPTSLVLAQADPLPNRFVIPGDNVTIGYPHGWTIEYDAEAGTLLLSTSITGMVTSWLHAEDLPLVGIAPGDAIAALEYFFTPLDMTIPFDPTRVMQQTVDGRTVYTYKYQDIFDGAPYDGVLVAAESSNGSFFSGDVFGLGTAGVDAEDVQEALRIVASAQFPASSAAIDTPAENLFPLLQSGIGVALPDGWTDVVDEDGFLTLESARTVLEPFWFFAEELPGLNVEPGDVPGVLATVAGRLNMSFDLLSVSATISGGRPVWNMTYQINERGGSYEAMLAGVLLEDGSVLVGFAYPGEEDTLDERADVLAILASAQFIADSGETGELLSESFSFEADGITFYYPATWTIEIEDDFVYLVSDLTYADPYYTLLQDLSASEVGDPVAGLAGLFDSLYSGEGLIFDPTAVQIQPVGEYAVVTYAFVHVFDGNAHEHLMTAIELEDGSQFYLDTYPAQGSSLAEVDTVLQITASASIQVGMPSLGEGRIAIRMEHER